jgi:hypothetical protein
MSSNGILPFLVVKIDVAILGIDACHPRPAPNQRKNSLAWLFPVAILP